MSRAVDPSRINWIDTNDEPHLDETEQWRDTTRFNVITRRCEIDDDEVVGCDCGWSGGPVPTGKTNTSSRQFAECGEQRIVLRTNDVDTRERQLRGRCELERSGFWELLRGRHLTTDLLA